ncbi:efflux RND transporter permease subunit [Roseicella frigidaeris]|uniref:CusA/CzcA family heavy metal efflux RND transporter n=1 Tax=Roseicella frigidaeris TaxID=2230885 RepID=A0A327M411_9PROT|nr:CusA/CzcA family heavy metal efflux RND transporter [Roseicella frigidaeris]RAI58001.1 CusA/CzcA family heavy metal efflux RND transporter [Roseicella frigidaeris]
MIARILDIAVQRRWLVVLLVAAAAGLGLRSLQSLPIDAVPDITNNQVQINTLAPALSPQEVEKQVTFPVETAMAGIRGLQSTRSLSRNGFSQVVAIFADEVGIYHARQQVLERLAEAREALPPGVEPRLGPISTGLGEIVMWVLDWAPRRAGDAAGEGRPGWQADGGYLTPEGRRLATALDRSAYLRTLQDWVIRPQLRTVPGVAGVDAIGGHVKQYHVEPDPAKLIGLGLSFADLAEALERNNASRGAGYIERGGEGYVVRSGGRLEGIEDIGAVVVATREGVPVRIRDLARVGTGRELRTGSGSVDGREAVIGTALMLIGENSRTVAAAVEARIGEIARTLPPGIELRIVLNRTALVDATIRTVAKNLAEGALLVIAVLFLLLGNLRAAVVTALVIPVTMLLAVTGMLQGGLSANLMSLGALDFGLIVDGAVIVTENSLRHLAARQHALGRVLTAAERLPVVAAAAREMIRPSLFGQAIIILVYLPLLAFQGVEGKMFAPMALTVVIALLAACVLSLTFVPAMIALAVTGRVRETESRPLRLLRRLYAPALDLALRRPLPVISGAGLLFLGALLLGGRLGSEFIPQLDEGNIAMHALRIPSTALTQSQAMQLRIEQTVSAFPEVAVVFSKTGTAEVASDPMPVNVSDTFIILRPRAHWPDPALPKAALIRRLQEAVGRLPGNNVEFTQPIQMRFNELLAGTRGDLSVKVFGEEFAPMLAAANRVAGILRGIAGAEDVRVEQATGLPVLEITVDKAEIARRGLSLDAVQEVIGTAIGGRQAGWVFEGDRRFAIVVRLPEALRSDLEALRNLPVALPGAGPAGAASVPLRSLTGFRLAEGPNQVSRENGKRRVVVTANIRGRDIASVVAEAQAQVAAGIALPPGYFVTWGGQFESLQAAERRLMVVVPAAFFLIVLLLATALGTVREALLVFSAVPLGLTGGIALLWLRGMPLSVSAVVGFIALSGVAVLNGLVMLNRVAQLRAEGHGRREAVRQGALDRLRPVAMTALVAALGFLPMALATGPGAEVQKPIATVVIGGLVTATLLTLMVLPALYARFGSAEVPSSHPRGQERKATGRAALPATAE